MKHEMLQRDKVRQMIQHFHPNESTSNINSFIDAVMGNSFEMPTNLFVPACFEAFLQLVELIESIKSGE